MKKLHSVYKKYREYINYIFFGGLTTVVSWGSYALFAGLLGMSVFWGNALSWVCAVLFAFVTNKKWVFFSGARDAKTLLREGAEFFLSRGATGVLEWVGVPFLNAHGLDRPLFGVPGAWAKILVTVLVIVLNYFLSKFVVFRHGKTTGSD